jgi:urease accessory protein
MLRAISVKPRGTWTERPADIVVLAFDDRHRRRIAMKGVRGSSFLLDLAETIVLHNGDALVLEDQRLVEIVAAPESLAEIKCADPRHLARIAWHLGNRHLPVEFAGRKLRIRRDHVIEAMIHGLGGTIAEIEAPFEPEAGAYTSHASGQDHDHHHPHDHPHSGAGK